MASSGDDGDNEDDGRECEEQQEQDLREDHPDRESSDQQEHAEFTREDHDRHEQPLVLTALLHRVGRRFVGNAEPVVAAIGGRVGVRKLLGVARVQGVVLGVAFVGPGRVRQEVWRVLVEVVDAERFFLDNFDDLNFPYLALYGSNVYLLVDTVGLSRSLNIENTEILRTFLSAKHRFQ